MPAVTPLPTPSPSRSDSDALFTSRADSLLGAFPLMVTEINAAIEAMNLNSTNGTSVTSLLIGTGSKTLVVETGKSYVPGQTLKIAYTTDATKWMLGDVTAYNTGTGSLTVFVAYIQGSGTFAAWTVSLSAPAPVTIPSGSQVLFYNATAPTGWVQNTTADDYAIRLATAGGGTPSIAPSTIAFSVAFASKAVTGTNAPVTLDTTQIPPHTHPARHNDGAGSVSTGGSWLNSVGNIVGTSTGVQSGTTGQPHNHGFTGTAINMAVRHINMILCIKS